MDYIYNLNSGEYTLLNSEHKLRYSLYYGSEYAMYMFNLREDFTQLAIL